MVSWDLEPSPELMRSLLERYRWPDQQRFQRPGSANGNHDRVSVDNMNRAESLSGPPSWEPLDGDQSGVGERLELRVSRHHDTSVILRGDDGEGIGVRDREAGLDVGRRQHRRS